MAENENEGIQIPENQQEHEQWEPTAEEQRALAGGWKPDKSDMADPDAWVSAREFNFRGELMDRITKQGRTIGSIEQQLSEARNMIAASDRVTQKLISQAVEQTRRDLRKQRREALEEDDHVRADQIDEELDNLRDQQAQIKDEQGTDQVAAAQSQRQPTPIEAAWFTFVTSTPWAQDPNLNPALLRHAEEVRAKDPNMSVGDFMESVLDKGKELRGLSRPATPPGGPDNDKGSRQGSRQRKAPGFTAADLNDQQRFIGQGYVDDGIISSLDDYAKELGEAGGLSKQQ